MDPVRDSAETDRGAVDCCSAETEETDNLLAFLKMKSVWLQPGCVASGNSRLLICQIKVEKLILLVYKLSSCPQRDEPEDCLSSLTLQTHELKQPWIFLVQLFTAHEFVFFQETFCPAGLNKWIFMTDCCLHNRNQSETCHQPRPLPLLSNQTVSSIIFTSLFHPSTGNKQIKCEPAGWRWKMFVYLCFFKIHVLLQDSACCHTPLCSVTLSDRIQLGIFTHH